VAAVTAAAILSVPTAALASAAVDPETITVSGSTCAPGWTAPPSGDRTFVVANHGSSVIEVDLIGGSGKEVGEEVYAEIERLAPHTSLTLQTVLPPGRYAWRCRGVDDGTGGVSNWKRVTGQPVSGAHPYVPVDDTQVTTATLDYRSAITAGLGQMATDADQLAAVVDGGQLTQARALWLTANLQWEELGAAYDTFGTYGTEIDGRPNGLPGGVDDPHFTGLLRLEYGLWHGQPTSELTPVADDLDTAVHQLVTAFPTLQTTPNNVALRTHEILENTLQFELTGEEDEGSHTELATAWANVVGTQTALSAIAPLLKLHDAKVLTSVTAGLDQMAAQFHQYLQPDGTWTPLATLTTAQREQLDGSVGALLEQLAEIPDLLDVPPKPGAGAT